MLPTTKSLTLQQLLEITPLEEDVRKRAIENIPRMNETEKFQLEQICWETLMGIVKIRTQKYFEEAVEKIAKGESTDKIDEKMLEDRALNEVLEKIENVLTETQIAKVKEMLRQNTRLSPAVPPKSQN